MLQKFNYDIVKEVIESKDCKLIDEEYIGVDNVLNIVFTCGHAGTSSFYIFTKRKTTLCEKCSGSVRLSISDVLSLVEGSPLHYLSGEYLSNEDKLSFIDDENYKYYVSFTGVKVALRKKQTRNKLVNLHSFCIENIYVMDNINNWIVRNEKSFKLIGGYFKDAHQKTLKLECLDCGWRWEMNWNNIKNEKGCPQCSSSKGERRIERFLKSKQLEYDFKFFYQYSFSDCRFKSRLRYDFGIIKNDELILCEYNGKYHFEVCEFFGGEECFMQMQEKYKIKKDYSIEKNIKLIEIPYWDFDNIEEILMRELNL